MNTLSLAISIRVDMKLAKLKLFIASDITYLLKNSLAVKKGAALFKMASVKKL